MGKRNASRGPAGDSRAGAEWKVEGTPQEPTALARLGLEQEQRKPSKWETALTWRLDLELV